MAKYELTSPDGQKYEVEAPDDATEDQVLQYFHQNSEIPQPKTPQTPSLRGSVLGGLAQGAFDPIQGGAQLLYHSLPESVTKAGDRLNNWLAEKTGLLAPVPEGGMDQMVQSNEQDYQNARQASGREGFDFARLGGNIASTLPLSLGMSGSLATQMAKGAATGGGVSALYPVQQGDYWPEKGKQVGIGAALGAAVPAAVKGVSWAAKHLSGLSTGTSSETMEEAFKAGHNRDQSFWDNLNNKVPQTDVIDDMKANLYQMAQDRANDYRSGMFNIKSDKTILGFQDIDKALQNSQSVTSYKGQVSNNLASKIQSQMQQVIDDWKNLDPNEFHTPEGFDFLKKQLGQIQESIPYNEKTARMVAGNIYNSVKDAINTQAPTYSRVMGDYSKASDLISEIERTLSLKETAAADTTMRKLQSLMRNNVQTSYGNRLELAKQLVDQGGKDVMPALAGQALSPWLSRGLAGKAANIATVGVGAATHNPMAAALLAAQSPKLMGAAAYGMGNLSRLAQIVPYKDPSLYAALLQRSGDQ